MSGRHGWVGRLVRLYPHHLRIEFGDELTRFLEHEWRERNAPGLLGVARFAGQVIVDLVRSWLASPPPPPGRRLWARTPFALVSGFWRDLALAGRGCFRSPAFTTAVVVLLAGGVGANAAVFSLHDRLFVRPPAAISDPGTLTRLYLRRSPASTQSEAHVTPFFRSDALREIRKALAGSAEVVAWSPSVEVALEHGSALVPAGTSWVTHDFFAVLGVGPAVGHLSGDPGRSGAGASSSVVLSHQFWRRAFGARPDILGQTIGYDGVSFTVIGVAAPGFVGLDLARTDAFFPLGALSEHPMRGPAWQPWAVGVDIAMRVHLAARVLDGSSSDALTARADAGFARFVRSLPERTIAANQGTIVRGSIVGGRGPAVWDWDQEARLSKRVAAVAAIILLITWGNLVTLFLLRAARRVQETGVRLALGGTRARLLSHALAEASVLAVLGALAAALVAMVAGPVLRNALMPDVLWAGHWVDVRTTAFALGTSTAMALTAGLLPALGALRGRSSAQHRTGPRPRSHPLRPRNLLVVAQAALSVVLLMGAGLLVRSVGRVDAVPVGWDVEHLGVVWIPSTASTIPDQSQVLERVAETISSHPSVSGVAFARHAPFSGSYSGAPVTLPEHDSLPKLGDTALGRFPQFNYITPAFFTVTGLRLISGRAFTSDESGVVVVSETLASTYWPDQDPIGRCVVIGVEGSGCSTVVGVVADVLRHRLIENPYMQAFIPLARTEVLRTLVIRVAPSEWDGVAAAVHQALDHHFGPQNVRTWHLRQVADLHLRPWTLGARVFLLSGALALIVTMFGVYSVVSHAMVERLHEVGVRIAMGAGRWDVLRMLAREWVRTVLFGVAAGSTLVLGLGHVIAPHLYGVRPTDPPTLALSATVLIVCGVVAGLVPTWRAARTDPMTVLTAEQSALVSRRVPQNLTRNPRNSP